MTKSPPHVHRWAVVDGVSTIRCLDCGEEAPLSTAPAPPPPTPFCKNCRHYGPPIGWPSDKIVWTQAVCGHPTVRYIVSHNLVTGEKSDAYPEVTAATARQTLCGFEARYFEEPEAGA